MGVIKRMLGSTLLWSIISTVLPMFLLVMFIIIVNLRAGHEESFRTETTIHHANAALKATFSSFFASKLQYAGSLKHAISNGVWADHTDLETFTHLVLPSMNIHAGFKAAIFHHEDGSFQVASRVGTSDAETLTAREAPSTNIIVAANPHPGALQVGTGDDAIKVTNHTDLVELTNLIGAENISKYEVSTLPVLRRSAIPEPGPKAAEDDNNLYTNWKYVSPLPSDVQPFKPTSAVVYNPTGAAGSGEVMDWYNKLAEGPGASSFYEFSTTTSQLFYASRTLLGHSRISGVSAEEAQDSLSTRVGIRHDVLTSALEARPVSTCEAILVRMFDKQILLDTRESGSASGRQYVPAVPTILYTSDEMFGHGIKMNQTTGKETIRGEGTPGEIYHFPDSTPTGRYLIGGVLTTEVALIISHSFTTTTAASVRELYIQMRNNLEEAFTRAQDINKGSASILHSDVVTDMADPASVSKVLVPYFQGISSFVDEILLCQGNITLDLPNINLLGWDILVIQPCYQVKSREEGFIDVVFWPGNVSNLGRLYNLAEVSAIDKWTYNPYLSVSRLIYDLAPELVLSERTPTFTRRFELPFLFDGVEVMSLPACVSWPSLTSGLEVSRGSTWTCMRFLFRVSELHDVLVDAALDKAKVAGSAAVVTGTGYVLASVTSSGESGQFLGEKNLELSGLQKELFNTLVSNPGLKWKTNPTSGDYVQLDLVFDGGDKENSIYVYTNLPKIVGKVVEEVRYTAYRLDGLVVLAFLLFFGHLIHTGFFYQDIRHLRKVLLDAAALKITPEDQRRLREKSCTSNTDFDDIRDHAFFCVDTIERHRGYVPEPTQDVLKQEDTIGDLLEGKSAELSRKAQTMLKGNALAIKEQSVVYLSVFFPSLRILQSVSSSILPQLQQSLQGTDGKWHRTFPVTNGYHSTALSGSAYWLPEESQMVAAGVDMSPDQAEAAAVRKAWSVGWSWVLILQKHQVNCVVTLCAGRSFAGNLGPMPREERAYYYKQFVVQGYAVNQSQALFATACQERPGTGGGGDSSRNSGLTSYMIADPDTAQNVNRSEALQAGSTRESLGDMVMWIPEEQTPLGIGGGRDEGGMEF